MTCRVLTSSMKTSMSVPCPAFVRLLTSRFLFLRFLPSLPATINHHHHQFIIIHIMALFNRNGLDDTLSSQTSVTDENVETHGYITSYLAGLHCCQLNSKHAPQHTTCPKKSATIFLPLTLPDTDRFSKFFHRRTTEQ